MTERPGYLRALLRLIRPFWRIRRVALWSELFFWDRWLARRSSDPSLRDRLKANRPVAKRFWPAVDAAPNDPVRILEVGSGPIPAMGTSHPTRRIEVVATDFLAKQYERLLKRYGMTPPVRAVYADMEQLSQHFGSNAFDLVYASNCVDHTEDALRAILEMVAVLRPGGRVIMDHMVDEGAQQDYAGLHRWNMNASDGRLLLWNERARHDIGQVLGTSCEIRAGCTDGIVTAEIRRLA